MLTPILTDDMKRVVSEQQLGFIATVAPDGAKAVAERLDEGIDGDRLIFADIASPGTVANLRMNPRLEINVVDPIVRKGYRFKGIGEVLDEGARFDELLAWLRANGTASPVRSIVLVQVSWAAPIWSPAYDEGRSEAEVGAQWEARRDELRRKRR